MNTFSLAGNSFQESSKRQSYETVSTVDCDEDTPYWEDDDWIPRNPSGKQRTPNQIRNEFRKYIAASVDTQTAILKKIGVNSNSFGRFMNPKNYKDQWSACDNGTYWAAARLLEEERVNKKKLGKKTKATSDDTEARKKRKVDKENAAAIFARVANYSDSTPVYESVIYDSCPQLVKKINKFLQEPGITQAALCRALDIQAAQLTRFLNTKHQDGAGTIVYPRAWVFFERKRILEGQPKSPQRKKNETEQPMGFSQRNPGRGYYIAAAF